MNNTNNIWQYFEFAFDLGMKSVALGGVYVTFDGGCLMCDRM